MAYSALDILTAYIHCHGPIRAARVSSAQARGAAKRYSYWGAVRYQIRLTPHGPSSIATERASSDRRSKRLADRDCDELEDRENRIRVYTIGRLCEASANGILTQLDTSALILPCIPSLTGVGIL